MSETIERLRKIAERADDALAKSRDGGASPVLVAVVEEFRRKLDKALNASEDGLYEAVVEAEQAADSAKYAAEADTGISEDTREAIVAAHDRICVMKTRWES